MHRTRSRWLLTPILTLAGLALPQTAGAVESAAPADEGPALHADVEIDPLAYALSGFSLHAGIGYGRLRVDLGTYALALPQLVHGDDGFDLSFDGYGVKLQLFFFAEQSGLFVGVDGGLVRGYAQRQGTQLAARQNSGSVGVNTGYRIPLGQGFYVTPWIGLDYLFGGKDISLAGATTKASPISVFPTVHLGYRFR